MKVVCFGESMLEVKIEQYPKARFSYGGDAYNSAYYLALQGNNVYFMSSIGSDKPSQRLLQQWKKDGVKTDFVHVSKQKKLGLYCIETDSSGERSFSYWRDNSASRYFFLEADTKQLLTQFNRGDWFYFSLISLAMLKEQSRAGFITFIKALRQQGVSLAFDNNYRPELWESQALACDYLDQVLPLIHMYLPSVADEMALRDATQKSVLAQLSALKIAEIVVKNGADSCHLYTSSGHYRYQFESVVAIDSTAAGDSFNAGYISARLNKKSAQAAVESGCQLASQVIKHPGAIVPADKLTLR